VLKVGDCSLRLRKNVVAQHTVPVTSKHRLYKRDIRSVVCIWNRVVQHYGKNPCWTITGVNANIDLLSNTTKKSW